MSTSEVPDAEQRRRPLARSVAGKYSLLEYSSSKRTSVPANRPAGGRSATAGLAAPDPSLSIVAEGASTSSPRQSHHSSSLTNLSPSVASQRISEVSHVSNLSDFQHTSPKVIALTAAVEQNRQLFENFQHSALSAAIEEHSGGLSAQPSSAQAVPISDESRRLVSLLRSQLAESEEALAAAKAELAFSQPPPQFRRNPQRLARPKGSLKYPSYDANPHVSARHEQRRLVRGFYSKAEAAQLRHADEVGAEQLSQDSIDHPMVGNGYYDDGSNFINDADEELPAELISSSDDEL